MKTALKPIKKLWNWLDNQLLFFLAIFLFVFIPLYPKLPLFDILPGYIVRVRFEDLIVLTTILIYVIWWLRRKVNPFKNPLFWLIFIYLGIGFISGISAILITKTVPFQFLHIAKLGLHWARRVEYMFLLFLFYDAIKTQKKLKFLTLLLTLIVLAATIYGWGQKYYQWPVYSTMNREFSKGWRLVLTEHARVPSTFAGHYDLAAFLVLSLPIILVMGLLSGSWLGWLGKIGFIGGYILLILTASRASFISYVISIVLLFILLLKIKNWKYLIIRFFTVGLFSALIFFTFGDLSGRFAQIINFSKFRGFIENKIFKYDQAKPNNYLTLTDQLALVADKSDVPPIPYQKAAVSGGTGDQPEGQTATDSGLPPDVYQDIPVLVSTKSASGKTTFSYQSRQYSDAAFTYGLSSAIRFDALWPRAIAGFKRNPLLGSGYSTLTKEQVGIFTEAESTDNDYLRALGETGLLGFIAFFGTICYALWLIWQQKEKISSFFVLGLLFALIASTIGLLINATYIDVFEASKVAFIFWALLGAVLAQMKNLK